MLFKKGFLIDFYFLKEATISKHTSVLSDPRALSTKNYRQVTVGENLVISLNILFWLSEDQLHAKPFGRKKKSFISCFINRTDFGKEDDRCQSGRFYIQNIRNI